jgi:hypothetical protein
MCGCAAVARLRGRAAAVRRTGCALDRRSGMLGASASGAGEEATGQAAGRGATSGKQRAACFGGCIEGRGRMRDGVPGRRRPLAAEMRMPRTKLWAAYELGLRTGIKRGRQRWSHHDGIRSAMEEEDREIGAAATCARTRLSSRKKSKGGVNAQVLAASVSTGATRTTATA